MMRMTLPMLGVLVLGLLPLFARAGSIENMPVDLAIVISFDRSESIDRQEARAQITGLAYTLRQPRYHAAIAGGYYKRIALSAVTWSSFGKHQVIMPWMVIASARDGELAARWLEKFLGHKRQASHGTQTDLGFGIEVAVRQLQLLPWKATDLVINVVADGISNIGRLASIDRNLARLLGININGLIMAQKAAIPVMKRYFKREVIAGPTAFVQVSHSNQDFAEAMLRKILREMVRLRAPKISAENKNG